MGVGQMGRGAVPSFCCKPGYNPKSQKNVRREDVSVFSQTYMYVEALFVARFSNLADFFFVPEIVVFGEGGKPLPTDRLDWGIIHRQKFQNPLFSEKVGNNYLQTGKWGKSSIGATSRNHCFWER